MENRETYLSTNLWELFDNLRRKVSVEDSLEILLALAVIAKLAPEGFKDLYKSPRATLIDSLHAIIKSHKILKELDSLDSLNKPYLTNDSLAEIVYFLNEVTDFSILADVLIEGFSASQGKRGGEVSTTPSVVEIIKKYVGDVSHLKIYDGAAGICALTTQLGVKKLVLEDINTVSRNMGKNLLLLKGIDADYTVTNSLLNQRPSHGADLVITQPPWGMRLSQNEMDEIKSAKYLLCGKGEKIPASAGDSLWIQQGLYHANGKGIVIMLLPQGWLFRGGYDADLREYLLEHDYVQAVIGLPAGVMQHTAIPSVILVFNKSKARPDQGIVHFVDASGFGREVRKQKILSSEEIEIIADLAKGKQPDHEIYRAVLLPEIYQNENDLSIKRYIKEEPGVIDIPDPTAELTKLKEVEDEFTKAQLALYEKLNNAIDQ